MKKWPFERRNNFKTDISLTVVKLFFTCRNLNFVNDEVRTVCPKLGHIHRVQQNKEEKFFSLEIFFQMIKELRAGKICFSAFPSFKVVIIAGAWDSPDGGKNCPPPLTNFIRNSSLNFIILLPKVIYHLTPKNEGYQKHGAPVPPMPLNPLGGDVSLHATNVDQRSHSIII